MKHVLLAIVAIAFATAAPAQAPTTTAPSAVQLVSVSSKGEDVRGVLHDLFTQVKKSYLAEPNIHFALYLSLDGIEFEEALALICKTANLKYELQNGVYFISRAPATKVLAAEAVRPQGKLPVIVLRRKVSANFEKIDLRLLFKSLGEQTQLDIEVDPKVPSYTLDAVLKSSTLKAALQDICQAAGLSYRFTDHLSIEVFQPTPENHVTLHAEPASKG